MAKPIYVKVRDWNPEEQKYWTIVGTLIEEREHYFKVLDRKTGKKWRFPSSVRYQEISDEEYFRDRGTIGDSVKLVLGGTVDKLIKENNEFRKKYNLRDKILESKEEWKKEKQELREKFAGKKKEEKAV